MVQEHLETFFAQVELKTAAGLPQFVKDEFKSFLECGILAHGFLRLRYGACAQGTLVAFSCKWRGFCPVRRLRNENIFDFHSRISDNDDAA